MNLKKGIIKNIVIGTTLSIVSCTIVNLISPIEVSAAPVKCPCFNFPKVGFSSPFSLFKSKSSSSTSSHSSKKHSSNNSGLRGVNNPSFSNIGEKPTSGILKNQGSSGASGGGEVKFDYSVKKTEYNEGDPPNVLGSSIVTVLRPEK